jgi:hypothetical protein
MPVITRLNINYISLFGSWLPDSRKRKLCSTLFLLSNYHLHLEPLSTSIIAMESLIPQQIRTELGQILSNLVLGDNEIRRS